MNLHSIVAPIVGVVNPLVTVTLRTSTGTYTTNPDFSRTPIYSSSSFQAQIQALTFGDLRQVEGLNLNGLRRAIYLYGNAQGVVRTEQLGGSLITFPDGSIWLIAMVLETWGHGLTGQNGWCKVAVTLQTDGA